MKLVSMKLNPAKAQKPEQAFYNEDPPEYGYGLRIDLDEDALQKLGIKELPDVESIMNLEAMVEVCSVSSFDSKDGEKRSICLQITDMALSPPQAETTED